MCLQASKNIWKYRHTRLKQLQHFKEPNWVPTIIKFQVCFHICCFIPFPPDHLLPGLPTLFFQPACLVNGIKEAERWLKKPLLLLHYFSSGSIPSTAGPHRFYHRMQWIVQGWEKQARQKALIKQHHWMWAWSLGEATAISVTVAAGLSPLSLATFLPTSSQTSCLWRCSVAQYNKPIRRLTLQSGLSPSDCWLPSKGTGLSFLLTICWFSWLTQAKKEKKLISSIFYWRVGYRNSRMGNWDWEQRRGACTLLGHIQLIQLQRCTESGAAFPISQSSAVSSPFLWAGISLLRARSTGHLANQSRWDTITVWTWQHGWLPIGQF